MSMWRGFNGLFVSVGGPQRLRQRTPVGVFLGSALLSAGLVSGCGGVAELQGALDDALGTNRTEPPPDTEASPEAAPASLASARPAVKAEAAASAEPAEAEAGDEDDDDQPAEGGGLFGMADPNEMMAEFANRKAGSRRGGVFGGGLGDGPGPGVRTAGGTATQGATATSSATCCVNRQFFDCPDSGAAVRCLGKPMQLFQCAQACDDGDCNLKCAQQFGPDPSQCRRQSAKDASCAKK